MGFSSLNCLGCGHPMLSRWATNQVNDWMRQVVVIRPDGVTLRGEYDGYGRVSESPIDPKDISGEGHKYISESGELPACWHQACWLLAGKPAEYTPSKWAADQGFFFGNEHDIEEPV